MTTQHIVTTQQLASLKNSVAGLHLLSRGLNKVGDDAVAASLNLASLDMLEILEAAARNELKPAPTPPATQIALVNEDKDKDKIHDFIEMLSTLQLPKGQGAAAKHTQMLRDIRAIANKLLGKD